MTKKEYSGNFIVRINPSTHKALAEKAFREGKSLNQTVKAELEKAEKKYLNKSLAVS